MRLVGDGALVAALTRTTGTGMRDIVATIQKEQNEAIRSPALGVTIVRGGPGTGKTAVALHRAAYLLYSDRQRFAGGGVLVVGPSPVFVSYISRVLPSLGEDDVTLASLGSLVVGVEATRHDPDAVATVKGSLRMARVLARAVRDNAPGAPHELRLLYRGTLLRLTGNELSGVRHALLDELDELLGTPPAPPRRHADPFTVQGVREVTTYADRMAAARGVAFERPADYREYAHIVVDESQDVSPMQWRMVGRRGEYASWTVVGDPAQAAWAGDPAETAKARDAALGTRRRSEHLLTTNYRNSAEIFAVAADVVRKAEPDIELPVAVRRTGVAPRHVVVSE